jgi:hypothetical protein
MPYTKSFVADAQISIQSRRQHFVSYWYMYIYNGGISNFALELLS